jgi:Fic family protein
MLNYNSMNNSILMGLRQAFLDRGGMAMLPEWAQQDLSLRATHGTNALEGNTLTLDEARTVISGVGVGGKPIRDILETIQHESAFRALLISSLPPVDMVTVLRLHEQVFRGLLPDAGQWRHVYVHIHGSAHSPPRMEKVIPLMESLIMGYSKADLEGNEVIRLGAELHARFESIHPFSDGNGRVGRLMLNLHFLRHNWPPISLALADRKDYIQSLELADSGNLVPLEYLLRKKMATSLVGLLDQVGTAQDELRTLSQLAVGTGHSAKYLSLRCQQGALPGKMEKGEWKSSERAVRLYLDHVGRG